MMACKRSRTLLWAAAMLGAGADAFVGGKSSTVSWQHSTQLHKQEQRSSSSCIFQSNNIVASLPTDDPRVEPRIMYKIDISLPMGLTLEEMDSDPSFGVVIVGISPEGNAAKSNANVFSKIKSPDSTDTNVSGKCICIRDKIISINGKPCEDKSFDHVVELISNAGSNSITLEIGRIQGSTVVNYDHGVCISAKPGENYGFLASKCNVDIDYECRTGSCQTCMTFLEFPNKQKEQRVGGDNEGDDSGSNNAIHRRTIFHCIGKMPRGYEWLHVLTGKY